MGLGAVFKITPTGQEGVVHSFAGGSDGANPYSKLAAGRRRKPLRDHLEWRHIECWESCFVSIPVGKSTVLYSFTEARMDFGMPYAGVIRDAKGNALRHDILHGGALNAGVVYRIDAAGQDICALQLYQRGRWRQSSSGVVIFGAGGNLLGTT